MSEVVGSLSVELLLDRSKLDKGLNELKTLKGGTIPFAATLDTQALRQQIRNLENIAPKIRSQLSIDNLNVVESQLKTFTRDRSINVGIRLDERSINQQLQALTQSRIVRLQAALINATAIERQIGQLSRDRTFKIAAQVDLKSADQALKQLTRNKLTGGFQIPVTFQADTASIANLKSQIGSIVVPVQLQYGEIKPGILKQEVKVGESGLRELEGGIAESVQKGFKKAQNKGLIGSLGDAITSPFKNIFRGFQEGIGITYSQKITGGVIKNLEKELGVSLNRVGEKIGSQFTKVGKFAGDRTLRKLGIEEGLAGLPPKLQEVQKFFNEIIDEKTLNRKFSVLETQIGKLVDDLLTLKGISTQIGNVGAIGRSLGDIAATPVEGVKERRKQVLKRSYDRAQARAAEIQAQKFDNPESIVFASGGFAGTRGKSSPAVAERLQLLTGEKNPVVPISNTASDLPYNVGEGKLKFVGGAIKTLVGNALKGYNEDAIEAAAQAIAAQRANPNAKINFAGYSQGGFIAQEAVEILDQGGIQSRGVGIGTPRFGLNSTTTKGQFQSLLGEGDPLLKLSKLFGVSDYKSFKEGGKAHRLSAYLGTGDTQQAILKQLGIKREVSPELKTRVPFEFADFEEELGALANDVGGVLSDPKQALFFKKSRLYQAQLANIAKHRSKIAEFIDQAVGSDIERLEAYDEALAEAESVVKQAYNVRSEVKPGIKAQNRPTDAAVPRSIAVDSKPLIDSLPDLKESEPIKPISNIKDQLGGYNVDVLKEISRVAGLQTSGNKAVLTDRLLSADSSDVENAIRAVTPLIDRGTKGGQKLKKVNQTDSEKRLLALTKESEKRINDALRLLQTAEGKRRQDIIDAALNEIRETEQILDRVTTGKVVSAETRASAGRQKGRLSAIRNEFTKPPKSADDIELARVNPVKGFIQNNQGLIEDLAVNTAGFAASQIGNQFGIVPGLAGDLGGALVARQALNVGKAGIGAYRGLKDSPQFQQAKKLEQARLLARQTQLKLQSQAMQRSLGDNLTGDVAGFAIGNGFANAANAGLDAVSGAVPGAGLLRALPFKGAFAAALTVPKIIKARRKFSGINLAKADNDAPILQYLEQVDRYVAETFKSLEQRKSSDRKAIEGQLKQYIEEQLKYTAQFANGKFSDRVSSKAASTRGALQNTGASLGSADQSKAVQAKQKAAKDIQLNMQQTYQLLVREAAKLSGIAINPRDIPKLVVDDAKLKQIGARALYSIKNNQIIISKEVADLMNGTLSDLEKNQAQLADIIHEARHSFQFDFGRSTIAKQSLGVSKPGVPLIGFENVPRDVQYNAARSAQIANQQAGGLLPKSFQRTIARTEADAYAFEKFTPKITGSAIEQLRNGTAPKAIDPNAPNEKLVDFFRNVFKFTRNPVATTKGAIGNIGDRIKATLLSGLSSQSAKAQERGGIGGLLANIPVPDGVKKLATIFRASSNASDEFRNRLKGVRDAIENAVPGAGQFLGNVKGLVAGFIGFQVFSSIVPAIQNFASETIKAAIALERVKTSLDFSTGGKGGEALKFVKGESDRLGLSLSAAQSGYSQLAASTKGTLSARDTEELAKGLNAASASFGLTDEQYSGSILALSQISSKGKLSAEELRGQLAERIPGAFGTAARSLGISEAELNKQLELGAISSQDFLPKFSRQLQIEYGASGEKAAGGTQASLNRLNTSVAQTQQSLGTMFTPAVSTGAKVLAGLLDLVANNLDKVSAFGATFGLVFIAPFAKAIGLTGLLKTGLGLVVAGFGAVWKQAVALGVQFVAITAAMEGLRSIGEVFALSDKAKQFEGFADQGEKALDRIEKAAKRVRGEIDQIPGGQPLESQGFDLTLGIGNALGLGTVKTDDLINFTNDRLGTNFNTVAKLNRQREDERIARFASSNNELLGVGFDKSGEFKGQLAQASQIDREIASKQSERARLAAQPRTDKQAIAKVEAKIKALSSRRSDVLSQFTEYQAGLQGNISTTKTALERKDLDPNQRKNFESQLKLLEQAQAAAAQLERSFGTPADRVKELRQALTELSIGLDEVQRKAEVKFNIQTANDINAQISALDTDENASLNASVKSAQRQANRTQDQLKGNQELLDSIAPKLNTPEVQERLSGIVDTNTGKSISVNSSIGELEKAKAGKDDLTKGDIDLLIGYKKAIDQQKALEAQGAQERLAIRQAEFDRKMALLEKEQQRRELANRKSINTEQVGLINRQKDKSITQEDAAIESAKLSSKQVGLEADSNQKQLQALNAAKAAREISEEQFQQKRIELEGKASDLAVQKAQSELAVREALDRKKIKLIQNEVDAQKRASDARIAALDREKVAIEGTIALMDRKLKMNELDQQLLQATSGLRQSTLKGGIDRASEASDLQKQLATGELGQNTKAVAQSQLSELGFNGANQVSILQQRQALQTEMDQERIAALQKQQELERQSLELSFRKEKQQARINLLEKQNAVLKAEQNVLQSQGDLRKAIIGGDKNEIENTGAIVDVNQKILDGTRQQLATQSQLNGFLDEEFKTRQQISGLQQDAARQALQQEADANRRRGQLDVARAMDQSGAGGGIGGGGLSGSGSGGIGGSGKGFGLVGADIGAYDRGSNAIKKAISDNAYRGQAGQREAVLSALQMSSGREKEFAMMFASQSGFSDVVNALSRLDNLTDSGRGIEVASAVQKASLNSNGDVVAAIDELGKRLEKSMSRPNVSLSTPDPVSDYASFLNERSSSMLLNS